MNSFSLYSFGAVCEWMFQNLVGIDGSAPGYQEVRIAPRPTGTLTWAKGHYDSIRGRIAVAWEKNAHGQLTVSCTVPANVIAHFPFLPHPLKT
ncbi:MAG: alpha-L-rhamnosidase C-terminal domain-containing protein [Pirellulales bacterium]